MDAYPKISIVTPSFNDAKYLESTVLSLINQDYPNLEYIIIDGGSTDGSLDIIKKYENRITYWISEKDEGMYDALRKGFERSSGDIMGWINSDDKHQHGSLFILAQIFSDFNEIRWLQGIPNIIDNQDRIIYATSRPEIDKYFFYCHKHIKSQKYIQQESTFWRRNLWEDAGGFISQHYKYAGDFDLWIRFFQYAKLYNIPALLGSFRVTGDHQSSITHYQDYVDETIKILNKYPLNKEEMRQLRYLEFFNNLEKRLTSWISIGRNRHAMKPPSIINNKIQFDYQTQKFRMR